MRTSARNHPARCASRLAASALLLVSSAAFARAAEYTLMPSPQTVHIGHFLASVKPVLTIDSGDIVTIESAAAIEPRSSTGGRGSAERRSAISCATSIAR